MNKVMDWGDGPPTALRMLCVLDDFLSLGTDESKLVWDVLTGLRGPDSQDAELKRVSTERIRARAFPKAARTSGHPMERVNTDDGAIQPGNITDHFGWHAEKARRALDKVRTWGKQ